MISLSLSFPLSHFLSLSPLHIKIIPVLDVCIKKQNKTVTLNEDFEVEKFKIY